MGGFMESRTLQLNKNNKYNIIMASDGVWDLFVDEEDICADKIVDIFTNRWSSPWLVKETQKIDVFDPGNRDDVCCAIMKLDFKN